MNDLIHNNIDNKGCEYTVKDYFDFIYSNKKKRLAMVNKSHLVFLYSLKEYFKNTVLINIVDDFIDENNIDLSYYNKITKTIDNNIEYVHILENLKNKILCGIKKEYTALEKSIFIYLKMCKMLSYDPEVFVFDSDPIVTKPHENIDNLKNIEKIVVCYEFIAIYSKMLLDLNINYELNNKKFGNNFFGGGHSNLKYRYDEYLVYVDPVTSIMDGDLIRCKLNLPLVGIKCINNNSQRKEEFNIILNRVYKYVNKITKTIKCKKFFVGFNFKKSHYLNLFAYTKYLNSNDLSDVDAFAILMYYIKTNFKEINFFIIKNNKLNHKYKAIPIMVIMENNNYYIYEYKKNIFKISKLILTMLFDLGLFEYKIDDKSTIDNINDKNILLIS